MSLAYVDVVLDRPRRLQFRIPDFRDLERLAGKPIGDVLGEFSRLGAEAFAMVLWAGLKHGDRMLTPERAGGLIDAYLAAGRDIADLRAAVNEALVLSGYFGAKARDDAGGGPDSPPQPTPAPPAA